MTQPNPFDPISMGANVIANLATSIMTHIMGAERFENTLFARILISTGLRPPSFKDDLNVVIKDAVKLFFDENSHYCVYGVESFLKQPETLEQIRYFIMDRRKPVQTDLSKALEKSFHTASKILAERRGKKLVALEIINAFFDAFKESLANNKNIGFVAVLLAMHDSEAELKQHIKAGNQQLQDAIELSRDLIIKEVSKITNLPINDNKTSLDGEAEFNTTVRWMHLADLPIDQQYYDFVLEQVQKRINDNIPPHFVFITGDVTKKATLAEFETFNENLVLPLLDLLGNESVFVVPGDMDVDKQTLALMDFHTLPNRFQNFFDQTQDGLKLRQQIMSRFQSYISSDITSISGNWLESQRGIFTYDRYIHDHHIGIMGINTALLCTTEDDCYHLAVGKKLVKEGLTAIRNSQIRFVLGHHPVDWLTVEESTSVQRLFGKHKVIYLHGHLGDRPEEYIQQDFGYSEFVAGMDAQQVNHIIWGHIDIDSYKVSFTPIIWSKTNGGQALFAQTKNLRVVDAKSPSASIINQEGWENITISYLEQKKKNLEPDEVLTYFEGTLLEWKHALTPQIPRLKVVKNLVDRIAETQIVIFTAPGGEGKSTSLRQAVCDLTYKYPEWNILWCKDLDAQLNKSLLDRSSETKQMYLFVIDDAAHMATNIFQLLSRNSYIRRNNIKLLLASRDTDWRSAGAHEIAWSSLGTVAEIKIEPLTKEGALSIVRAWRPYGEQGLGKLINYSTDEEAADALLKETRLENYRDEGAFLGALLRVRGDGLRDRVHKLLIQLEKQTVLGTHKLIDIYAYIAIPHAHGLLSLSKEVLSSVFNNPTTTELNQAIRLLGKEVVVKDKILVRHRNIAEAAVTLLPTAYGIDSTEYDIMADLLYHTSKVRSDGIRIAQINDWNYYSKKIFDIGKEYHGYGIQLAEATLRGLRSDAHTNIVATLASLYRRDEQIDNALDVLRNVSEEAKKHRAYFAEWALCEYLAGHWWESIYLGAIAVSDQVFFDRIDDDRVNLFGRVCSSAFNQLKEFYPDFDQQSQIAVKIKVDKNNRKPLTKNELVDLLRSVSEVYGHLSPDLPNWLLSISSLSFQEFERYLKLFP